MRASGAILRRSKMVLLATVILGTLLSGWARSANAASDDALIAYWKQEWPHTDFVRRTVPLQEIQSGGPPKNGIPAIDRPRFESVDAAAGWLDFAEPVIALELGGRAKAYPLSVLIWHEIVNDRLAETPVAVTFCPLCNASIVFERRVAGAEVDFGTTGKLRYSDMVMYDRQSETLVATVHRHRDHRPPRGDGAAQARVADRLVRRLSRGMAAGACAFEEHWI